MRRLLVIGRRVGRWIVEGLATDHVWCWGYVYGAPPPYAWRTADDRSGSPDSATPAR